MKSTNNTWSLLFLSPLVLLACGGTDPAGLDNLEGKADWYDSLRVPHYVDFEGDRVGSDGEIEGMLAGTRRQYRAPTEGWIGSKTILRKGAHLNLHTWTSYHEAVEISVEIYRWQGVVAGWGEALVKETGTFEGFYPNQGLNDYYFKNSFTPLESWVVPEDGRYLFLFHTGEAYAFQMHMDTNEKYYDAASCADDPGICKRLDSEASCGFSCYEQDAEGSCTHNQEPTPYCGYGQEDRSSWVALDEESYVDVDDVPLPEGA